MSLSKRVQPGNTRDKLEALLSELRDSFNDLTAHHHEDVRQAIVKRYRVSCNVVHEPALLAALGTLVGKAVSSDDAIKFVFKLSLSCPKKASKYYRRIKPIWDRNGSSTEVYNFLKREGLENKATMRKGRDVKGQKVGLWAVTTQSGKRFRIEFAAQNRELVALSVSQMASVP